VYAGGDNQIMTLKIATEASRIIRNILNQHKRMWVMDLCPICNKLPTSPEHFFVDSAHTNIFGVYGTEMGPTGPAGAAYNDFRSTWYRTHPTFTTPGNITQIQVTASGSGYSAAPGVQIVGGGFGASGAHATASLSGNAVSSITITNNGAQYTAIPTVAFSGGGGAGAAAVASLNKPDNAGIASAAFYGVLRDYKNGIIPSTLSTAQLQNFNNIVRDGVFPIRILFDVQVQSVTPTDEAVDKSLYSLSEISLKCKELLPVERFGPNFSGSIYNPQEAL
jgi:hypothetical protein